MNRTLYVIGLLVALGTALGIRLLVTQRLEFDGLYGQDSFAYYYHGLALWHDHALQYHWPWLPAPTRLYWPLGYPALLALAFGTVGHASAHAAQAVTLGCGTAVTALTYALTLRIARPILPPHARHAASIGAAMLVVFSGLQVQASTTIMSDAPALCWAMTALLLWTSSQDASFHRLARSFLAGVFLALAISTRYEYAPLVAAPAAYWWLARRRPGSDSPSLLAGLIGAVVAGAPQLIYSVGYSAPVLNNEWLTEWNLAHVWQASFSTPDGTQHYAHSVGAFYLLRPLVAPESLPWVLAPFLPLGLLALAWNGVPRPTVPFRRIFSAANDNLPVDDRSPVWRRGANPAEDMGELRSRPEVPRRLHWPKPLNPVTLFEQPGGVGDDREWSMAPTGPWLGLLATWWLAPTIYLVGVPFESARFALIAQPPQAILEGIGLVWTIRFLSGRRPGYAGIIVAAGLLWGAGAIAIASANSEAPLAALAQGKVSDLAAVTWLRNHASSGSVIVTFDLTLTLYHYGDLNRHHVRLRDLSALDPADWTLLAHAPRVLAVANVGNLARQWHGLPPDQALMRLVELRRLAPIATAGVYTIYG